MAATVSFLVFLAILAGALAFLNRQVREGGRRPPLVSRATLTVIGRSLQTRFPELHGIEQIERRLTWAGHPFGVTAAEFLGLRLLGLLFGLGAGYIFGGAPFAVIGAIGLLLPDAWLKAKVKLRQTQIERELLQFCDYWLAAVEAGLELMTAVGRVAQRVSGPLGYEFRLAEQEVAVGYPTGVALTNLARRCGVTDLDQVVAVLIAADRYGTSIADQLRIAVRELRALRSARARQRAAQIGVSMKAPLLALILPGILLLMLAPVAFHLAALFQ